MAINSRRVWWVGYTHGKMRNAYNILRERPEEKRPLGRCIPRCVDIIKVDLK
jgi:hypothetical protein